MNKMIISLALCLVLTSCSLFHVQKLVVQQGNVITPQMTSQLHNGMSESDVRAVMGNPVTMNIFTPNRIEYVYTYQRGVDPREEKRVTCMFVNGQLSKIIQG